MLKRAENKDIAEILENIGCGAFSARISSNLSAYKTDYPFCEFWFQQNDEKEYTAFLSKKDGVCTLTMKENADIEEMKSMLFFADCKYIEAEKSVFEMLDVKPDKTRDILTFDGETELINEGCAIDAFNLKEVFSLLKENEGESIAHMEYLPWLSDFTFKRNRKAARIKALVKDNELVSFAMTSAETEKEAVISGVVTKNGFRKKGFASKVLSELIGDLKKEGKTIYVLTAQKEINSFYEKSGFRKTGEWARYRSR